MEYSTLIENVVDAGHVPFTHHASVSKRQSSGMFEDMRIEEKGPWGFKGIWPTGEKILSLYNKELSPTVLKLIIRK